MNGTISALIQNMRLACILVFIFWRYTYAQIQIGQNREDFYRLEVGDEQFVSLRPFREITKVWIEDKNIIKAVYKNNKIFIKALKEGECFVRLNSQLIKIVSTEAGSRHILSFSDRLRNKFAGLDFEYCGNGVCAVGELYRLQDYVKLLKFAQELHLNFKLKLKVDNNLANKIKIYVAAQFRENGLTPQKISFSDIWKVYSSIDNTNETLRRLAGTLALQIKSLKQLNVIEDNISVSVKIVELQKSFMRKIGLQWPDQYRAQVLDLRAGKVESFEAALNAAEANGEARILASPNLLSRSGKEALFFAGGEYPIKVRSLRSQHIVWKKYGVGLKLFPRLDALGQLNLRLETEVSSVDRSLTADDMPAFAFNRVSSYFDLVENKTITLSGLIKNESSHNAEGLPFLKNIPVLGALFSSRNFTENKTELVIFVTPRLLKVESEAEIE